MNQAILSHPSIFYAIASLSIMSVSSEFLEFVKDQLVGFSPLMSKRLFGGYGIYKDGVIFAIIIDDVFYLKLNPERMVDYRQYEIEPFQYIGRNNKEVSICYWEVPSVILEDLDLLHQWTKETIQYTRHLSMTAKRASIS